MFDKKNNATGPRRTYHYYRMHEKKQQQWKREKVISNFETFVFRSLKSLKGYIERCYDKMP